MRSSRDSGKLSVVTASASASNLPRSDGPFRVVGVALVVDQRGVGARLVARYPTQASEDSTARKRASAESTDTTSAEGEDPLQQAQQQQQQQTNEKNSSPATEDSEDADLFFRLTARQMAKLFRTKKSLCGRPMTLAVNGTVFCCRPVLMNADDKTAGEDSNPNESQAGQLDLFSVIVAMSSPTGHTAVPFSSWLDTATEDQLDIQRYIRETAAAASAGSVESARHKTNSNGRVSSSFLSIRRVHISLARYCRVLEREERRCQYISLQSNQLFQIRNQQVKLWEEQHAATLVSKALQHGTGSVSSSASGIPTKSGQGTAERRPRHIRSGSVGTTAGEDPLAPMRQPGSSETDDKDLEQEILELMLAAPPPESTDGKARHHGNIIRELVQLYHSLSRNDHVYPPTPAALLHERDGVVYVNQHIAIPIDAASLLPSQISDGPLVRPYYTLLFPHASPSVLLLTFQSSGAPPPQHLQQLLLTVNAQKSLVDIAVDANLPLHTTMEMASYLVAHGACVMSPVVLRSSRLACFQFDRMQEIALDFSQLFPTVHLHRLLGFLTSVKTLGEAMNLVTDVENGEGAWLRESFVASGVLRQGQPVVPGRSFLSPEEQSPKGAAAGQGTNSQDVLTRWEKELEEQVYAMTVWLLSRRVLVQMQEYLVAVGATHDDITAGAAAMGAVTTVAMQDADENLFRELMEADFLNGDISVMALSARLGLDQQRVRSWGLRHRRIRIVTRVPKPGDD